MGKHKENRKKIISAFIFHSPFTKKWLLALKTRATQLMKCSFDLYKNTYKNIVCAFSVLLFTSLQIMKNNKTSGPIYSRQCNSKCTIINIKIDSCFFFLSHTHQWHTKFCVIVFLWCYYKPSISCPLRSTHLFHFFFYILLSCCSV